MSRVTQRLISMENKNTGQKRQIYLWDENMEFFNQLKNKSKLINLLLRKYRQENETDDGSTVAHR